MAKIYAVGVGPGDPDLLTIKAERILRTVRVVCAPTASPADSSYALSIVEPLLDRNRQEVIIQVFPMRLDQAGLEQSWESSAAAVAEKVRQGNDVAFITIGDPFFYSTFVYLYHVFREKYPQIPIEIVPGITSINAAAVAAGIPLGMAAERIAVIPAAFEQESLRRTLAEFDTIILLKMSRVFDGVYDLLRELGLDRNAVYVSRAGSPDQEVVRDLATLVGRRLDYLSLLIVKK